MDYRCWMECTFDHVFLGPTAKLRIHSRSLCDVMKKAYTTLGGAFGLDGDGRGVYAGDVGVLGMEREIRVDVDYEGFAVVVLRYTFDSHVQLAAALCVMERRRDDVFVNG